MSHHSPGRIAAALAVLPLSVVVPALLAAPSSGADVGRAHAPTDKPAAEPTATFVKGVLTVRGTSKGQAMSVVRKGRKVTVRVDGARVPLPKGYRNGKCDEIRVLGLAGDDRLTVDSTKGALPDVVLVGGKGDDVLTGGDRDDVLDGGKGDDELRPGGGGNDVLEGGIGADTYVIDGDLAGGATVDEPDAGGPDHVSFADTSASVSVNLVHSTPQQATASYLLTIPNRGVEDVTGGSAGDTLIGGSGANRLQGGPGDDVLWPNQMMGSGPDEGNVLVGDAGDDTFRWFVGCLSCGTTRIEDSSGSDTLSFVSSGGVITTRLDTTEWQTITPEGTRLQLGSISAVDNVIGGDTDAITGNDLPNRLNGWYGDDTLTGQGGPDVFVVGGPYSNLGISWGADTVTDFAAGSDTVDLDPGLSVKSGLGTSTVVIWDGTDDRGTFTASNGHLWAAEDFA
jgi:Ca2+-binding RTX toxin-like protein